MRLYKKEHIDFIRSIAEGKPRSLICELFREKFPMQQVTENQIKALMGRYKIKNGLLHKYTGNEKRRLLNDEQTAVFIKNNYGKTLHEMGEFVRNVMGVNLTDQQVDHQRNRLKLKSGLTGQFEKGHKSWNKGLRILVNPKCLATCFKKGHKNKNELPVWSEVLTKDGYISIKVTDIYKGVKSRHKNWQLKHRYIWEQAHGKIPKGYVITFLDQNRLNCSLDNLTLIKNEESLYLNRKHLLTDNADINATQIKIVQLKTKIKEIENKD